MAGGRWSGHYVGGWFTDTAGRVLFQDGPLGLTTLTIRDRNIGQGTATEDQLHGLEGVRRVLLNDEAAHAVSWLWRSDAPSVISAAEGGTTKMISAPLAAALPLLRRRGRRRGVLLAALFRSVVSVGCIFFVCCLVILSLVHVGFVFFAAATSAADASVAVFFSAMLWFAVPCACLYCRQIVADTTICRGIQPNISWAGCGSLSNERPWSVCATRGSLLKGMETSVQECALKLVAFRLACCLSSCLLLQAFPEEIARCGRRPRCSQRALRAGRSYYHFPPGARMRLVGNMRLRQTPRPLLLIMRSTACF